MINENAAVRNKEDVFAFDLRTVPNRDIFIVNHLSVLCTDNNMFIFRSFGRNFAFTMVLSLFDILSFVTYWQWVIKIFQVQRL